MKFNFSFDIALFTTIFTIYLFVCGYFYYDGLISYYGFSHVSLGISLQDYLMYGWLNGMYGLIVGFLILIIAGLVHTISQNNLYEAMVKFIFVIFTFIILFIFNLILKKLLLKFWKIMLSTFNFIIKSRLHKLLSSLGFFWITIGNKAVSIIKPAAKNAIDTSEKMHKFDVLENSESIDKVMQSSWIYNIYLMGFYILFVTFTFYVLSINTDANKEAEKKFNSTSYSQLIINDELITQWFKDQKLTVLYPIKAKIMLCGTEKCLIAIHTSNLKYENGLTLNTKNNYLMKLVNPDSYVILK